MSNTSTTQAKTDGSEDVDYGLRIDDASNDGEYIVIGDRGNLVVQSTAVPQSNGSTWVAVTAFSSDSAEAEKARNDIRARWWR